MKVCRSLMMILKKNISIPGNQQKPPKKRETKAFRLISNLLNAQGPDGRLTSTKEKQRSFSTQTDETITLVQSMSQRIMEEIQVMILNEICQG